MGRKVVACIVGYAVWTGLWLGGNALFFQEAADVVGAGEAYTQSGPLARVIALSVGCSLLAGLLCGRIGRSIGAVRVLGLALLGTGIAVQGSVWALMPVWYHLTFLLLLVPVTVLGGMLGGAARAGA